MLLRSADTILSHHDNFLCGNPQCVYICDTTAAVARSCTIEQHGYNIAGTHAGLQGYGTKAISSSCLRAASTNSSIYSVVCRGLCSGATERRSEVGPISPIKPIDFLCTYLAYRPIHGRCHTQNSGVETVKRHRVEQLQEQRGNMECVQ